MGKKKKIPSHLSLAATKCSQSLQPPLCTLCCKLPRSWAAAQRAGLDKMTSRSAPPNLNHSLTSAGPATATLLWQGSDHGSVQHTVYIGQSDSPHKRRKMNLTSASTSPAALVSTAWELQMLKRKFELPSPAFCVQNSLVFLLIMRWLFSFPHGIHPLLAGMHSDWKKEAWPQLPQEDCSLMSTLAVDKTYGNDFFQAVLSNTAKWLYCTHPYF